MSESLLARLKAERQTFKEFNSTNLVQTITDASNRILVQALMLQGDNLEGHVRA